MAFIPCESVHQSKNKLNETVPEFGSTPISFKQASISRIVKLCPIAIISNSKSSLFKEPLVAKSRSFSSGQIYVSEFFYLLLRSTLLKMFRSSTCCNLLTSAASKSGASDISTGALFVIFNALLCWPKSGSTAA